MQKKLKKLLFREGGGGFLQSVEDPYISCGKPCTRSYWAYIHNKAKKINSTKIKYERKSSIGNNIF